MKFQVYAGSLAVACDAYIAAQEKIWADAKEETIVALMEPRPQPPIDMGSYTGWWLWRKWVPDMREQPDLIRTRKEAEHFAASNYNWYGRQAPPKAVQWRAIAKHKMSNILLEVTDEEIGDIALYLPVEGKTERI